MLSPNVGYAEMTELVVAEGKNRLLNGVTVADLDVTVTRVLLFSDDCSKIILCCMYKIWQDKNTREQLYHLQICFTFQNNHSTSIFDPCSASIPPTSAQ